MGTTASKNRAAAAYRSSGQRLPPVHRPDTGACQDIRPSKRPCATTTSTQSVSPDSMFRRRLKPVEPPWYATRTPGGVGGAAPRGAPLSRSTAGFHAAEGDQVHPDLFRCPIRREIAREIEQARFRRGIGDRLDKRNAVALFSGGVERLVRRAAARLRHVGTHNLTGEHDAGQVGVDDLVPILLRITLEGRV